MDTFGTDTRGATRRILVLAAACLLSGAALAAPAPHTLTVRYADLKLDTPAGARALYARLQGAARFVCGEEGTTLFAQRLYAQCYQRAISEAAQTVNSPRLTALVERAKKVTPPIAALLR